ncbi:hypothetical protein [Aeromonas salmonicida]|uniref:hypothetical protein n=1 Tax=Aeromonas salmonicida TaxID=645 RepID=UPI00240E7D7B|nr:hypothetical protein [Aeromonas salmonicida]WFC12714.1 hypothetical protein L3V47_13255 [Aeromonas salmonicida]
MDRQVELKQRIKKRIHKYKQSQNSTESGNSTLRFWQDVLLFLPIIYGAVYLIGMLYHMGYLETFNLSIDEFPLSTDLTLLQGGVSLITMSYPHILYALLLFISFIALLVFLLFARKARENLTIYFNRLRNIKRPSQSLKETIDSAKVTTQLMDKSAELYARFVVLFVPLLILVFLAMVSMQSGISAAKKDQEKLLFSDIPPIAESTSSFLKEGPYLRVVCNPTHCAFWNLQGTLILRHDQIEKTDLTIK